MLLRACCFLLIVVIPAQLGLADSDASKPSRLKPIRISDGHFVRGTSDEPFVPWGFNYVGDFGEIVEEYWEKEWPRVEEDFREMRALGANVVRVHLQLGTYMKSPQDVEEAELERLKDILDLAEKFELYLDLTGLGCYHLAKVPSWYDELSEKDRWQVQAVFWEAIAKTCAGHPAVFCYDLINEPIITKAKAEENPWYLGELGGMYFVQRLSIEPGERTNKVIAEAWVRQMVSAIRKHDADHLITVGVIPWAQVFPGAKPLFYSPEVARHLDFVSVHFYPKSGEVKKAVDALAVYDIGKPLVVEEVFPLSCSLEELDQFIQQTDDRVDGWISHYFGRTIQEHRQGAEPAGESVAKFLEYWQAKGGRQKQ